MPDTTPSSVYAEQIPEKGTGLLTSKSIEAGELVFLVDRPLVCVPDNPHLNETCYYCFMYLPKDGPRSKQNTRKLQSCMGCKVARYCSKLLLRKKAGSMSESEWQDFMGTQDHSEKIKKDSAHNGPGLTKWQDIHLMSQAAHKYSGTSESLDLVQSITARCLVNSMTMTDGTFSTLGTCLSTSAALLNHSCNPNCMFIFSGASLSIRSLHPIPAGNELTISYVDVTAPSHRRQEELRPMYYFDCTCEYCVSKLTCGQPDVPVALKDGLPSTEILHREAEGKRLKALAEDAPPRQKAELLDQAMGLFLDYGNIYPLWRYPWPSIRNEVRMMQWDSGQESIAIVQALKAYFFIDPVIYPIPWHPIRTVRTFILLKMIYELQYRMFKSPDGGDQVEGDFKMYNIDWLSANKGLEQEIEAAIPRGFGIQSSFAAEYKRLPKFGPPEKYGRKMDWLGERKKLEEAAENLAE
ncbi:MAG: hypothetical protein Q9166_003931 [cf. Caloplaca sp. 2 TL-2023]